MSETCPKCDEAENECNKWLELCETQQSLVRDLDAQLAAAEARAKALEAGYRDCLEDLVCCGYQLDDYFQKKYGLDEAVEKHTETLQGSNSGPAAQLRGEG